MALLIPEIFEQIFQSFILEQLIDFQLVSKSFLDLVRKCHWIHTPVCLNNDSVCSFVLNHFKFRNLIFSSMCNVNSFIGLIKNCHTLYLSWTNITDESVIELKNCHTLDISLTKITDESVKELKNCHTLYISGKKITDESAKELKNCHTLHLNGTDITDECVKELRANGVHVII